MNEEIRWCMIPGFSNYEVSDDGQVRNLKGELISQHENKTSKGTYLTVNINNDDGVRKIRFVHRFVCMVFHELPENYKQLDVNHKDTNKHNNHYLNLEWETRSGNVKHAFITGANKHALAVRCKDILTGDIRDFISMKEVAEFLELGHGKGLHVVMAHLTEPYKGRYVFEVTGEYYPQKRTNAIEVYYLDLKSNTFGRYENLTQLQLRTGLIKGSVQDILKKPELRLFNGGIVCRVEDKERLFEYVSKLTQEMVNKSIDDYNRYKARKEKLHTT